MVDKFGLEELAKYDAEVGLKRGDWRTIRGVLAIVGIANNIRTEAQEAIEAVGIAVETNDSTKESLIATDKQDNEDTKVARQMMADARKTRKGDTKRGKADLKADRKMNTKEAKRLQKILNKFS